MKSGPIYARSNELNNQMNRMRFALFCDRANGVAEDTAPAVAPAADAAAEVEVARAEVPVQRSRPVVAVRATVVEARTVAEARSGQEDTITIRTGDKPTEHAIICSPLPSTFVDEFLYLI